MKIKIETDDLVSVPQAARTLGRPKVTLYRWAAKGKMLVVDLGGMLFIPTKEVERLKDQQSPRDPGGLP